MREIAFETIAQRVAQLALAGVPPREDLAVGRERDRVRTPCRNRHHALVADRVDQHQQALVVEVAVAQLQPGAGAG